MGAGVWNGLPWCRHLPENRQLIARVASDETLEIAFDWVSKRRIDYSHNSVWDLRRNWQEIKPEIQQALVSGDYTFSPLREIRMDSEVIELWCAKDALVLKALAIILGEELDRIILTCAVRHFTARRRVRRGYFFFCFSLSPLKELDLQDNEKQKKMPPITKLN